MASPKEQKLLAALAREPGMSVAACAERLGVTPERVRKYIGRLQPQVALRGEQLYLAENLPSDTPRSRLQRYVVIDTETTGIDVEADDLIELAALKVQPEGTEEFRRLVMPRRSVPPEVVRLTGLTPDLLRREGAELPRVLEEFLAFVGDLPWVGHNLVRFDAPLLQRLLGEVGLPVPDVPTFDSLHLAHLALWDDPPGSFSQDDLTALYLGGTPEGAHTAIVDVHSTQRLIGFCRERLQAMPEDAQLVLRALAPEACLVWDPLDLDDEVLAAADRLLSRDAAVPMVWSDGRAATSLEELLKDPRPGQLEMARQVGSTLRGGGVHVVEAPTGTGKTRAYLFPALLESAGGPVVVSTHTKQLQDQVIREARSLADAGYGVRVVASKGNANYLCPDRLRRALGNDLSDDERRALALLVLEAVRGEFDAVGRGPVTTGAGFARARQLASVHPERCRDHCPFYTSCAFQRKERAVREAQVVVVNHALAVRRFALSGERAEATTEQAVKARRVIFDEAHDLEDAAVSAFTTALSSDDLWMVAHEAYREHEGRGLLTALIAHHGQAGRGAKAGAAERSLNAARELHGALRSWRDAAADLLKRRGRGDRAFGLALRLTPEVKQTSGWAKVLNAVHDVSRALRELKENLEALRLEGDRFEGDVFALQRRTSECLDALYRLLNEDFEGAIYALEGTEHQVTWWAKPLFVREVLEQVWDDFDSLVLTSATLRLKGSGRAPGEGEVSGFGHVAENLALPLATYQVLAPVLPYDLAHLILTTHLPLPNHPGFGEALGLELHGLLAQLEARTLGLFTANSRLQSVSQALQEKGLAHLNAKRDGTDRAVEHLRNGPEPQHALGGAGLMQGLDVPGLSLVHLDKAPFPVPDLLLQAQQQALGFDRWWREIYLPRTVLRFVQAFGRLIREHDRKESGAFVIWDRRLPLKPYVNAFLEALPDTFRRENLAACFGREAFYQSLGAALGLPLEMREALTEKEAAVREFQRRYREEEPLEGLLDEAFATLFDRPGARLTAEQRTAIGWVHEERDVLAVLPTGSGKSLIFQLPALLQDGYVLVLSPLVALIQDQVKTLQQLGLPAAGLWGGLPKAEQQASIDAAREGRVKLLYVAPERLRRSPELRAMLKRTPPGRIVLDEAHCLSQWGFDFRPDYLKVADELSDLGVQAPVTALTATATPEDREEIVTALRMREPCRLLRSFERENLHYVVDGPLSKGKRDQRLLEVLKGLKARHVGEPHKLVVYAGTRKQTERLAALVGAYFSEPAAAYHAGLSSVLREEILESFLAGDIPVIVATNAFGMGVDAPDIRAVIHYDPPLSIEAYVQEAGRGGRDGKPAYAIALWGKDNKSLGRFLIDRSYPTAEEAVRLLSTASSKPLWTASELAEEADLEPDGIATLLHLLEEAGNLRYRYQPGLARVYAFPWTKRPAEPWLEELLEGEDLVNLAERFGSEVDARVDEIFERVQRHELGLTSLEPAISLEVTDSNLNAYRQRVAELRAHKQHKFEETLRYLEARACRRLAIASYFKDEPPPCERCDRCDPSPHPWEALGDDGVKLDEAWDVPKEVLLLVADLAKRNTSRGRRLLTKVLLGNEFSHKDENGKPVFLPQFLRGLPAFGRLAFVPENRIETAIAVLLANGSLTINKIEDRYEVIALTPAGQKKVRRWIRS